MEQILKIVLDNLSVFLQNVLAGVLPILFSLIAAWLIAKVKLAWQEWKVAHTATADILESIAKVAVLAAEQSAASGFIEDKKAYALEVVENYLTKLGLKIDVGSIQAAIEAAVMSEFNKAKSTE